jgi:hypothetical protein
MAIQPLAKILHIMGLLAKEETTYGTPVALAGATDGIQLQYSDRYVGAPMEFDYAADGELGPSVSALGTVIGVPPSGYSIRGPLPFRMRPGGAAYSASVLPSGHRMLKAAGLTATLDATGGSEKYTYAPTAPGVTFTSLSAEMYTRGEKVPVAGMIGSLKFDAPDTKPAIWTLDNASGIATLPTDAAVPSITYPLQSVAPPLASTLALVLGGLSVNAAVKSHSFDMQRQIHPRVNQSSSGDHWGFVPGDYDPMLKVTLEATALVTGDPYTSSTAFDPWRLRHFAKTIVASVQHGTTQYNKYKLSFPQCQVVDVRPGNDGPVPTVELTLRARNSTPSANDAFNLVFD